jgi:ABC-type polysaccharide/polyol phosphate transport system ATPase subunit
LAKAYGVGDPDLESFCKSIFDFASLGDAINRNVRGYSTGMRGKLGFGFMTALSPEVLLIDETLGVGDAEFRRKAQSRLTDFISSSGSVIISTHSLGLARQLCNRGLILDSGNLVFDGEIENALTKYRSLVGESV